MAIGGVGRAVADLPVAAHETLDAMEIFADGAAVGNSHPAAFERGAERREEFLLERGGEMAEFDPAGVELRSETMAEFGADLFGTEFVREEVAKTDTRAGVIDAGAADTGDARAQELELGGGGEAVEHENLSCEVLRMADRGMRIGRV